MNQTRLYNDAVNRDKKLKDELLLTMLQNAVQQIDDLWKIKSNADHETTMGKPELTYKQYVTLLLSAAATYDAVNDPKRERH